MNVDSLVPQMLTCEQTAGQTIWQHGLSVKNHFQELIEFLDGFELENWRLPEWLLVYKDNIKKNLHSWEIIALYTQFHDAGKPNCRVVDEDGKVHFPNHAEASKRAFLEAGGDPVIAKLIGHDMAIHTAKAEEIDRFLKEEWSIQDALTLLLAALAEIHSNLKLFGGDLNSPSFKIKWKQIDRRGNQICKHFFGEK